METALITPRSTVIPAKFWFVMLGLASLAFVACDGEAGADGSIGDTDWTLEGVSLDGRHLLVSAVVGGVASECTRFEEWALSESADAVEIRARVWERNGPASCTSEGVVEFLQLDLDQPLGSRELVGCGVADCRETVGSGGELFVQQAVATARGVAVADHSGLDAYTSEGNLVAQVPVRPAGRMVASADDAVVLSDPDGIAAALDVASGAELWRTMGWVVAAAEGVVYVCRGQDSDGLAAIDAASGEDLWATDLACEILVINGELLSIVSYDREVDGGHRLVVVDSATGVEASGKALDDGYDDNVTGFDGAVAVGPNVVASGAQANLVVLTSDGTELTRLTEGLGTPIGHADGAVLLGTRDSVIAFDVSKLDERWSLGVDAFTRIETAEGSVWLLDDTNSAVSRLDAQSGEPIWTTVVGVTSRFDVDQWSDTTYILTTQELIAVDSATGAIRWSAHRPHVDQRPAQ